MNFASVPCSSPFKSKGSLAVTTNEYPGHIKRQDVNTGNNTVGATGGRPYRNYIIFPHDFHGMVVASGARSFLQAVPNRYMAFPD
jgi:hypothetical protein